MRDGVLAVLKKVGETSLRWTLPGGNNAVKSSFKANAKVLGHIQ